MTPAHGAVVLAAGASKRLGIPKQLIEIDGEPALRRVVRRVLATAPLDTIVVLGHDAARIGAAIAGLRARTVVADGFEGGMSASLRAGVAALDAKCGGALIVLTDQPALDETHLVALRDAWRAQPGRAVASAYAGVAGVPAVLPRAWFDDVARLDGDVGARDLLRARAAEVVAIAAPELERDIDEPRDVRNA